MFIARWQIDARFGHKDRVIESLQTWQRDIGAKAGLDNKPRFRTGSIGAREATVEIELEVESLAELDRFFATIRELDAHRKWGQEIEPHVVSGTSSWQIYREL